MKMNRRYFLKGYAALGAELFLAPVFGIGDNYKQLAQNVGKYVAQLQDDSKSMQTSNSYSAPVVQSSRASEPPKIDGLWEDVWNAATLIDVPRVLPHTNDYSITFTPETGHAFLRVMDDDDMVYLNAEYCPPPDTSGQIHFNPGFVEIFLDPHNTKAQTQIGDYKFNLIYSCDCAPSGLTYDIGNGANDKYGGWGQYIGTPVTDSSFASGAFSITKTPTFQVDHPYYELKFSKIKLLSHSPFGLGILIYDQKLPSYIFPANDLYPDDTIGSHPWVWADTYFSEKKQISTTTEVISTKGSSSIQTKPTVTNSETKTSTNKTYTSASTEISKTVVPWIVDGGLVTATGIGIAHLYRHHKEKK